MTTTDQKQSHGVDSHQFLRRQLKEQMTEVLSLKEKVAQAKLALRLSAEEAEMIPVRGNENCRAIGEL